LEKWSDLCKVIFLTNDLSKLDAAVQRRCDVIELGLPPIQEGARILGRILDAEEYKIDPDTVLAFTRGHFAAGDDRNMSTLLRAAQLALESDGVLPIPPEGDKSAALTLEVWRSEYQTEDATDGAKLLNDLAVVFARYLSLPKGGQEAFALWTVFAWAHLSAFLRRDEYRGGARGVLQHHGGPAGGDAGHWEGCHRWPHSD